MLMRCSKRPRTAGQKSSGRGKFTRTALVFWGTEKLQDRRSEETAFALFFFSTLGCFKNPLKSVSRKSGGNPAVWVLGIGSDFGERQWLCFHANGGTKEGRRRWIWSERGNVQNQIAQRGGRICLNDTPPPPLYFARLRGRPVHSSLLFSSSSVHLYCPPPTRLQQMCLSYFAHSAGSRLFPFWYLQPIRRGRQGSVGVSVFERSSD